MTGFQPLLNTGQIPLLNFYSREAEKVVKTKVEIMQQRYGVNDKLDCRLCCNLRAEIIEDKGKRKRIYYCEAFSLKKQWRKEYPACGLYNMPFGEVKT